MLLLVLPVLLLSLALLLEVVLLLLFVLFVSVDIVVSTCDGVVNIIAPTCNCEWCSFSPEIWAGLKFLSESLLI